MYIPRKVFQVLALSDRPRGLLVTVSVSNGVLHPSSPAISLGYKSMALIDSCAHLPANDSFFLLNKKSQTLKSKKSRMKFVNISFQILQVRIYIPILKEINTDRSHSCPSSYQTTPKTQPRFSPNHLHPASPSPLIFF